MNKKNLTIIPYMLIILQSLVYGLGDPVSKSVFEVMPVYSLLVARYSMAAVVMVIIFRKRIAACLKDVPVKVWLIPCTCNAAGYVANNIALDLTAATAVSFLRQMLVIMTPIMAFVIYRTRYQLKHLPILVAVIFGIYLLCGRGGLNGIGIGEVWALISALMMTLALVTGEKAMRSMDPFVMTTMQSGMSATMALICALIFERGIHLSAGTPSIWLSVVYLALVCTIGGNFLQNQALRSISASTVSVLQCSCPVISATCAFLILGEKLNTVGICGAAIILVCVVAETIVQNRENQS